jgi:hypothetical protein
VRYEGREGFIFLVQRRLSGCKGMEMGNEERGENDYVTQNSMEQ